MPALEKGRLCLIKKGKNAGKKAKITEVNDNQVVVEIIGTDKKEKLSILHVEPLE